MKINVNCSIGNPESSRTWSGTPANFLKVLKDLNAIEAIFGNIDSKALVALKRLLVIYYNKFSNRQISGTLGFPLIRYLNAWSVEKNTRVSKSKITLHFGTLGLPLFKRFNKQIHCLYTDGVWNCWSKYATNKDLYSSSLRKSIDRLEQRSYNSVNHIFSTSEYVKENLINHYKVDPSKITVVGTGTGIIQPYYGKKDYKNGKILFVAKGRFEDKGGDLVLEAFKRALVLNPSLQLSIVGQQEYKESISHENITSYGFISVEELQELFNSHSLFLMPALNEPWGLVYLEAMLCKMPIMGLNRNSFPELSGYGKWGIGINEPDPTLLANIIVSLFDEPNEMERMGVAAQEYVLKNHSWELTVKKVLEKIEEIAI